MKRFSHLRRKLQQGSMLLEAVFGILIFSLGILALVGLQATSTKQAEGGKYRTDAALLANQLIGRMWITGRTASNLQTLYNSETNGTGYQTWRTEVQAALPGADTTPPSVTVTSTGQVTITVFWLSPSEKPGTTAHKYVVVTQIV